MPSPDRLKVKISKTTLLAASGWKVSEQTIIDILLTEGGAPILTEAGLNITLGDKQQSVINMKIRRVSQTLFIAVQR